MRRARVRIMRVHGDLKNGARPCDLSVSEKMGGALGRKNGPRTKKEVCPVGKKIARIITATGSLFIVAEGSPLSIIQRLLRETRCSCWNIRVFKAVRMNGRRVITG